MNRSLRTSVLGIVVLLAGWAQAVADVSVPKIFGDHMVLQQGMKVPVWGTASPGESVTVTLQDAKETTKAGEDGKWQVRIGPFKAGGPFELKIAGKNTLTITDVLIGEVWICSGQSNMGWTVEKSQNSAQEIAAANHPTLRLFKFSQVTSDTPQTEVVGAWEVCTPQSVPDFSGAAYFFGRELQKDIKVPVGLIRTSWGGTPAEAWTSREALMADSELKEILNPDKAAPAAPAAKRPAAKPAAKDKPRAAAKAAAKKPAAASQPAKPVGNSKKPTVLFNAMINPLIPYGIAGAIWYQGEANASRAMQYRKLLPAMITDWRTRWSQGEFPFLIVQLANYTARLDQPAESPWAELREAQCRTLSLPKTGLAVAIDIGEEKSIHPVNKQEVGRRLSLAARAIAYGEKIEYSGPMYDSMSVEGDAIRLKFKHVGKGLAVQGGGELKGFAIAGEDRKFVWADAKIDGDTVVVRSSQVAKPVAVRYAWANNPECNLCNKAELPASPFRTDDWVAPKAPAK